MPLREADMPVTDHCLPPVLFFSFPYILSVIKAAQHFNYCVPGQGKTQETSATKCGSNAKLPFHPSHCSITVIINSAAQPNTLTRNGL